MESFFEWLFNGLELMPEIVVLVRLFFIFFIYNLIFDLMNLFTNGRYRK